MPWFYVDDAFADSKPVMRLEARLRNEAIGLWVRCGAWSAKEETDGRVPLDIVKSFDGTPRLIRALHEQAGLWDEISPESWRKSREILFKNWEKWQATRAENIERRKADAERQKRYRARKKGRNVVTAEQLASINAETSRRDSHATPNQGSKAASRRDVTRNVTRESRVPDPTQTHIGDSPTEERSLNVGVERGLSDAVTPSASRLVATLIPDTIPPAVRTALRIEASQLMARDGADADTVAETLRRWLNRPGAGPGLLPHLAADVIRERATPPTRSGSKLRGLVELARQVRAEEENQPDDERRELA